MVFQCNTAEWSDMLMALLKTKSYPKVLRYLLNVSFVRPTAVLVLSGEANVAIVAIAVHSIDTGEASWGN